MRFIPGIGKSDGVRELPIAEEERDFASLRRDQVWPVELALAIPLRDRRREDAFVGRGPSDPELRQHGYQLRAHRAFGWPDPDRSLPENCRMEFDRHPKLHAGILRMDKS